MTSITAFSPAELTGFAGTTRPDNAARTEAPHFAVP